MDAAVKELDGAIKALQPAAAEVDKTALKEAIDKAGTLKKADYTSKSWNKFKEAEKQAKAVYADENATQDEVDQAVKALNTAMDQLEKPQTLVTIIVKVVKKVIGWIFGWK